MRRVEIKYNYFKEKKEKAEMLTLITTQMLVQCELLLRDFTCLKI